MNITDEGVLLQLSRLGEAQFIARCFTMNHGLLKGMVNGSDKRTILSIGSTFHITCKARLETHLGLMIMEGMRDYGTMLAFDRCKLALLQSVMALLSAVLNEGESAIRLYNNVLRLLEDLLYVDTLFGVAQYALFELALLEELGYGLDLSKCVATGERGGLRYVSPKSGCAVSEGAGYAYRDKLFMLPVFYLHRDAEAMLTKEDLINALKMNEFFLQKHVFAVNNIALPRQRLGLTDTVVKIKD
jgi:DNA repair protein RecO (recombination protein O)